MYVCVLQAYGVYGGQKRMLDPQKMDLEMVVGHHVGCGERIQVLCKSSKCYYH